MPDIPSIPTTASTTGKANRGTAAADSGKTGEADESRARSREDENSFTDSLQRQLESLSEQADESRHPQHGNSLPPGSNAAESGRTAEPMPAFARLTETTSAALNGSAEKAIASTAQVAGKLQQAGASATANAVKSAAGADSTAAAVETVLNTDAGPGKTDSLFASRLIQSGAELSGEMLAGRNMHENLPSGNRAASVDPAAASGFRAPAPLNTAADVSMSSPAQTAVSESFGRPEWSQGLGRQMLWMVNQNLRIAEMRMSPANLGPIEVRIEMDDDQVSVAFNSRHAVVREAVEQAIPRLREMFEADGLNLAHTDISQQSFADQRDSAFDGENGQQAGLDDAASASDDTGAQQQPGGPAVSNGLVDCYI